MTDPSPSTPAPASPPPPAAEPGPDDLAAAKREAAGNYDRYVRAVADLENYRRRAVREKDELRLFSTSRLLEDLLPVLDNLSLGVGAADHPNADLKTVAGGIELALQQFRNALAAHGLTEINPVGKAFDPHLHEAIAHEPSASVPAEHVTSVVRTGYQLHSRLLRPAAVVVSSGPPATSAAPVQP